MFWGATALFLLVLVLLAIALLRPSWLGHLRPVHWIVGGGLVLPVPILLALLLSALLLGERLLPHRDADQPMRIEAHARQWEWRFRYPEHPLLGETAALYLPAGEPVDIVATAEDVIHSFWVPRLGGKMDAIPGHANVIRLQADEPGMYRGVCAEYCGQGHETMGFAVEAFAPAQFLSLAGDAP